MLKSFLLAVWRTFCPERSADTRTAARKTGDWGEEVAARYLRAKGYKVVGRNVRPDRKNDEIDLIVENRRVLAFVEVKTRAGEWRGIRPADAVDARKRHALNRAAVAFLRKAGMPRRIYRFDIVEVLGERDAKTPPRIRHVESAFPFEERYTLFP